MMIDISQWRTSIGLWYHSTQRTNTDGGLLWSRRSGDVDDGYLATLSLILFISLLLILAGDIELNPGPTELTSSNAVQFLIDNGFIIKDKWIELITLLRVSLEERERLETMANSDQDFHYVLQKGLQWWITNSADPSWKELISAVENCGDKDIATKMREQLETKEEALVPEDILKEIQGLITWPQLGLVLNIEKETIERTAQLFGGDEEKALQHVVTNWLDNDPDASWEKLAKAVMRIPMLRQKGAQLYSKYVSKDLTADVVCKELEDLVQDWFQLGYMFLCNSQRVREAGTGDSNEEKQRNVIGYWLKSDPIASWELVARRIEDCFPQHEALADEIRQKHLPKVDTTPLIRPPTPEPETELSVKTAFKASQGVDDWYALGWFLKLKQEELIDIEEEHTRPDQRRNAVLQLWLEKHPISAEWVDMADALQCMPQHVGKSETIRTKYCKMELGQTEMENEESVHLTLSSELEATLISTKGQLDLMGKISIMKTSQIESLKQEVEILKDENMKLFTSCECSGMLLCFDEIESGQPSQSLEELPSSRRGSPFSECYLQRKRSSLPLEEMPSFKKSPIEANSEETCTPSLEPFPQTSLASPKIQFPVTNPAKDQFLIGSSSLDNTYVGQVVYVVKEPNCKWLMSFIVGKQLDALLKYIEESLSSNAERDTCYVSFEFQNANDGYIELVFGEEPIYLGNGWSIQPHIYPTRIYKKDVDRFGVQSSPRFPSCEFTVFVEQSPHTSRKINYNIPLHGVEPKDMKICLFCSLSSTGSNVAMSFNCNNMENKTRGFPFPPLQYDPLQYECKVKKVFRAHFADLSSLVSISTHRLSIAPKLFSAHLISEQCFDEVVDNSSKTDTEKGLSLMRALKSTIYSQPLLFETFITVLESVEAFALAEKLRQDCFQ